MHALCSRVQKMSSPLGLELRATVWVLGMKPSGANSPAQYFLRQTVLETCEDTFCKTEKLPREPGAEQLIGHLEVHVAVCIDCSRASLHLGKDSIHKVQCQDRRHLETTHKQVSLAPLLREGQNPQKICVPVILTAKCFPVVRGPYSIQENRLKA